MLPYFCQVINANKRNVLTDGEYEGAGPVVGE